MAHQGLRQLGVAHGGVDVFAGGGQQVDAHDATADATEAAPLVPVRHHLHGQAGAQATRIGRGEVGHGLQGLARLGPSKGAEALARFHRLTAHHLQIQQPPVPGGAEAAVEAQAGLGDPHGAAGVIDGEAPPLGFGVDAQLHRLPGVDGLPFADAEIGDAVVELDGPVFAGHHLAGQGGHHLAAGEMAEIGHLLVVDATQGIEAFAVALQLGQGRVPQAPGRGQSRLVASVEIGVDADQFSQILLLAAQLLFQGGEVEAQQGLPPAHPLAHPHRQAEDLALGPGIDHRGTAGHDHHPPPDHFGGHRPEQEPAGRQGPGGAEGHQHPPLRRFLRRAHGHPQPRSRSTRWVPTRRALAMAVREGFTAPIVGMKLVSTT